jgi:hypothetical protein
MRIGRGTMWAQTMKHNSAILLLCACFATVANAAEGDGKTAFQKNNPNYRDRAGRSYEVSYLPGAIKGLQAAFEPQQLPKETAHKILHALIYDFLDIYSVSGALSRRQHAAVIAKLDKKIKALVDDPKVLDRYEQWKRGGSERFKNPLCFLTRLTFQAPPVKLSLPQRLTAAGWRLDSLESLKQTGDFADVLDLEPYQVFQVENANTHAAFTLLLFRLRDAQRVVATMQKNPKRGNHTVRLFWRTAKHIVFIKETGNEATHAEIKAWIRAQWTAEF